MRKISDVLYWLKWSAMKVKSRDPLYLPRRLSYSIRKRIVDCSFSLIQSGQGIACFRQGITDDPAQLLTYFRTRTMPRFHFRENDIEQICSIVTPDKKEKTIKVAEDIVQHRFTFRGVESINLYPVDWDFRQSDKLDWIWDLNRHFYFATLGFAYWYTKDSRFARTFFELSSSWIQCKINNLGRIKWDHPFEVAARINGWIWAYFLFLNCPEWNAIAHHRFLCALRRLSEYLYQTIEYHNPGNHILLEAKALAICAGLFPEFKGADRWARKGWRILEREVVNQICDDGVHAERSTMYHRIVAGELAELALFCHRNNIQKVKLLPQIVERMAEFERWIANDDGSFPLFGDAYLIDNYFRFSSPVIADFLNRRKIDSTHQSISGDHTYWVIGSILKKGKTTALGNTTTVGAFAKAFPSGGYFVSKSLFDGKSSNLVWDCGPVGYHANLYHSHLDALSFTLSIGGVPVLIDPGTNETDPQIRRYLRSTAAHNTLLVDREEQSILERKNEVWSPAKARVLLWGTTRECDVMMGTHDGYKRLKNPVEHTRVIVVMRNKYWFVIDRVDGTGRHRVEQRFHVVPGASVKLVSQENRVFIRKEPVTLSVFTFASLKNGIGDEGGGIEIEKGISELECGRRHETSIIKNIGTTRGAVYFGVALIPYRNEKEDVKTRVLCCSDTDGCYGVELKGSGFRDKLFFCFGEKRTGVAAKGWKTDARVVVDKYDKDARIRNFFVGGATYFFDGSRDLLKGQGKSAVHKIDTNDIRSKV